MRFSNTLNLSSPSLTFKTDSQLEVYITFCALHCHSFPSLRFKEGKKLEEKLSVMRVSTQGGRQRALSSCSAICLTLQQCKSALARTLYSNGSWNSGVLTRVFLRLGIYTVVLPDRSGSYTNRSAPLHCKYTCTEMCSFILLEQSHLSWLLKDSM